MYYFFNLPILAQEPIRLDLLEVFNASPFIYVILGVLSLFAFMVWLYSLITLRFSQVIPHGFLQQMRTLLEQGHYDIALLTCRKSKHFTGDILKCGILSRGHGHQVMIEAMQTEGKRCAVALWQRLSLLNDVAVIAPMLGLLGTVLGLFYAFYDVNRSPDTLASIFDGLGIAVGTTVAGLIVAILAMLFYATLKFRIVKLINSLETETLALGNLIESI